MQKNALVAVAALALIATAALVIWLLRPEAGPETAALPAPAHAAAQPAVAAEPLSPPESTGVAPKRAEQPPSADEVADEAEGADAAEPLAALAADRRKGLDVSVAVPAGMPPDDALVVLAFSEPRTFGELYGREGVVPERRRLGRDTDYRGLVAVAPVGADGRARLSVPRDLEEVHVAIGGRYLYTEGTTPAHAQGDAWTAALAPELGALVTGRVIPPPGRSGEPSADVEVGLRSSIGTALSWEATGRRLRMKEELQAGGRYEFWAVPADRPVDLQAESDDFAAFFEEEVRLERGARVERDVALRAGGTVAGRVVLSDGSPAAEAKVRAKTLLMFGEPVLDLREEETDAEGRYELTAVRAGQVWVEVDDEDHLFHRTPEPLALGEGQRLLAPDITLADGRSISGTVMFPDGEPAAGVELELDIDFSQNVQGNPPPPSERAGAGKEAVTDAEGAFALRGLGSGPFVLRAELVVEEGERLHGKWSATLPSLVLETDQTLTLVLEEPLFVEGYVVDTRGEPVSVFEVVAEREAGQWYLPPSATARQEVESEDGAFVLPDLRSGRWQIVVHAEGFAPNEPVDVVLPGAAPVEITLSRACRISGVVREPDGRPATGALVAPELEFIEMFAVSQGRDVGGPSSVTDAAGRFELTGVEPGTGTLRAEKEGRARSKGLSYELEEGQALTGVELVLRVGARVTGEVQDDEGNPKAGAQVIVQLPTAGSRRMLTADDEGRFEADHLEPETWNVMTMDLGKDGEFDQARMLESLKMEQVTLVDGEEAHVVLGGTLEDPVTVRGTVTAAGEPASETLISFVPVEGGGMKAMRLHHVDAEGRYEVVLRKPGDYLVTLQYQAALGRQHSLEYRCRIPDEDEHELDLELPGGRISGRVYGPDGGPAEGERVSLAMAGGVEFGTVFGGAYSETITDETGSYELDNLRPGAYRVAAGGSFLGGALGEGRKGGRVVQRTELREGQWLRGLDFRLEKPGTLRGTVVDHAGKPAEAADVYVRDEDGNMLEAFSFVKADAGGRFEYEGLGPGRYTVSARKEGLSTRGEESVAVRSGEVARVDLVLAPGTVLLVSLEDKSGELVPAMVSAVDERGREMSGMRALSDIMEQYNGGLGALEQRIGPLPPGSYTVRAIAADGRSTKKSVTLSGQDERRLRLRLGD